MLGVWVFGKGEVTLLNEPFPDLCKCSGHIRIRCNTGPPVPGVPSVAIKIPVYINVINRNNILCIHTHKFEAFIDINKENR